MTQKMTIIETTLTVDSDNYPRLSIKIGGDFAINDLYIDDNDELEPTLEILGTIIDQIRDDRNNYVSGDISEQHMIDKYGANFMSNLHRVEPKDFDYFSVSLFITPEEGDKLIIVPTNEHIIFIYGGRFIQVNINANSIRDMQFLYNKLKHYYDTAEY